MAKKLLYEMVKERVFEYMSINVRISVLIFVYLEKTAYLVLHKILLLTYETFHDFVCFTTFIFNFL